jgi:hypothetical protein
MRDGLRRHRQNHERENRELEIPDRLDTTAELDHFRCVRTALA